MLLEDQKRTLPNLLIRPIRFQASTYALIFIIILLVGLQVYHIQLQPYPSQWDDSVYATHTYDWLKFISGARDIFRGIFWGAIYALPHHLPPMVFVTSLVGGLWGGTLAAMRLAHLVWFGVMLAAVYGTGRRLGGGWAGVLSAVMVGTTSLIFYWGKMIMGEPSLFAAVALTLFCLVWGGDKPALWRGAIIGGVLGFGMLTKQHFPVFVIGPLGVWVLWLGVQCLRGQKKWKDVILALLMVFVMAVITAGPWYLISWRDMLTYATQPEFPLHTLGPNVSWYTISTYFDILFSQLGWPAVILLFMGLGWTGYCLVRTGTNLFNDWKTASLLLLLVSVLVGLIVVIRLRNINTRFFVPALIPWGILSGVALNNLWQQRRTAVRIVIAIVVVLHLGFGWSLSFGPELPRYLTFFPQTSDLRPANMELLLKTFGILELHLPASSQERFWVVGDYHNFNQPTAVNLVRERGYEWQVQELHHWNDPETEVKVIVDRVNQGEWVAVYRETRQFYAEGEELVSRFDNDILELLQANPESFDLVAQMNSTIDTGQVWIFKKKL